MLRLTPCNHCGRHVRAGDTCCPFCKRVGNPRRLTQALVIAASSLLAPAALASSSAGDGGDAGDAGASYDASSWPDEDAERLGQRPVPLYGMPSTTTRGCRCDTPGSSGSGLGTTVGLTLAVAAVVHKRRRRS